MRETRSLAERGIEDFEDAIATLKDLMRSLWLTWESPRIKRWMAAGNGAKNRYCMTPSQYDSLVRVLRKEERKLFRDGNLHLSVQIDCYIKDLELTRQHPLIDDWITAVGVKEHGMSPEALKELHGFLRNLWEERQLKKIAEWEQTQQRVEEFSDRRVA